MLSGPRKSAASSTEVLHDHHARDLQRGAVQNHPLSLPVCHSVIPPGPRRPAISVMDGPYCVQLVLPILIVVIAFPDRDINRACPDIYNAVHMYGRKLERDCNS